MFRACQNLPLLGIVALSAVISIINATYGAEPNPPRVLAGSLPRNLDDSPEFIKPLHDIEGIFSDEDAAPFIHSQLLYQSPRRIRSNAISQFRPVSFDTPDAPAESGNIGIPAETTDRPMYLNPTDQLLPLVPTPEGSFPVPFDNCDPMLAAVLDQACCPDVENWSPIAQCFGLGCDPAAAYCPDVGIGHERVMFAPFEIDVTQPTNFWMARWDAGLGLKTPDRSEFFFSGPPKGPKVSPNSMNFQDVRFINEIANDAFSVQTEIPIRFIDPTTGSTSGLGDMKVATKARLVNGKNWQLTQILRTWIPTGSATKGVGTGHVSLEPGLLARYEINPATFIHGEVKLLIPIAGDPGFAANVMTYGVGISHVFYETNTFAFIPVFEMVNYDFLGGQKTVNGVNVYIGDETAVNVMPGARFVFGPKGDLGLFELGVSSMIGVGSDRYVNDLTRLDFKFAY